MPPTRTERTHKHLTDNRSKSERARGGSLQDLLEEQAYRRTAAEEAALHTGSRSHFSSLLDPQRHSVALDALIDSITEPPAPRRKKNQPHASSSALSTRERGDAVTPTRNYIDLTLEEDASPEATTPPECLAYCPRCKSRNHSIDPFDENMLNVSNAMRIMNYMTTLVPVLNLYNVMRSATMAYPIYVQLWISPILRFRV